MFKKTYKARYIRVILKARVWKNVPMKLLKWKKKMSSKDQEYDLVTSDEYDTRIPLYADEAFTYGISFEAKYIGTMDVPRPTSRVEIVAAMRRVRYEFKARGVKKRKVTMDVSIDGVRVTNRSKALGKRKKKTSFFGRKTAIIENVEVMHHPIYRIFYVSHDSSDLKIFSYIARDGATNGFKCNVFKSNRKSQAMRIVRTVGQAFEVCHKLQMNSPGGEPAQSTSSAVDEPAPSCSDAAAFKEAASDCGASEAATSAVKVEEPPAAKEEPGRPTKLDLLPPPPRKEGKRTRAIPTPTINLDLPECITKVEPTEEAPEPNTPLSAQHQLQLLRERLDQQAQQTRAAVAQLLLLRDQLAAEQAARCEAQARTHQLLLHNKELLDHIGALVIHLQEREKGITSPKRTINAQTLTLLPQDISNGNGAESVELIDLFSPNNNSKIENGAHSQNRVPASHGAAPTTSPCFDNLSNNEIQDYLITKFEEMGGFPNHPKKPKSTFNANQQFFQNCQAFPNIPPLVSHYSDADLQNLLAGTTHDGNAAQAMSVGQSDNSIFSIFEPESADSSKDSSDSSSEEDIPFIKPLSHNGTLTATGEDGRVRLIVPVSPSESVSAVGEASGVVAGNTLTVPDVGGPITRSTSEKVPHRSELMAAMRQQWTRHTTK